MQKAVKPEKTLLRNLLLMLPAVILFVGLTGYNLWRENSQTKPVLGVNGVPVSQEIEDTFGVQFLGVHVLARNGLVDLRYRVIDVGKAKNFGHYTETSPMIVADESGKTVEVTIMGLHNHRVEAGRVYYILYRNTGNALRPGSKVTIQIGDLRLENIIVQ